MRIGCIAHPLPAYWKLARERDIFSRNYHNGRPKRREVIWGGKRSSRTPDTMGFRIPGVFGINSRVTGLAGRFRPPRPDPGRRQLSRRTLLAGLVAARPRLALVAQRQVRLLVGRSTLFDRAGPLQLGVELQAQQDRDVREPEPEIGRAS